MVGNFIYTFFRHFYIISFKYYLLGDMESDNEKSDKPKENLPLDADDLSDVSDLDESIGGNSDSESLKQSDKPASPKYSPQQSPDTKKPEKQNRPAEEGEEQLDFEEEDGECADDKDDDTKHSEEAGEITDDNKSKEKPDAKEKEEGEELEEGEVTDEDDVRPEEVEPRPVCRFFSRGQCTWGSSCRFLHPGVTDKGNYTMFEMIRPVLPGEYGREERPPYGRPEPPQMESAWERGLRTAKEMLRKSIKRKEQDIDFEDKKKNLSLTQDELDKENGYYVRMPSPEPRYVRHPVPVDYPPPRPSPDEYFAGRRQVLYEPEAYPPMHPRERPMRPMYREPPMHRPPPPADYRYEEEHMKNRRSGGAGGGGKREVIVQRVVEERPTRGDEWSDPWMRSKSPGARKRAGYVHNLILFECFSLFTWSLCVQCVSILLVHVFFTNFIARLCVAPSGSVHTAQVLVIHPVAHPEVHLGLVGRRTGRGRGRRRRRRGEDGRRVRIQRVVGLVALAAGRGVDDMLSRRL